MDAPPSFAFDFFLSRRGSVAAVAQEVADVLDAEGYRVLVQDYDFAAGGQFVADIDDALKQARDLLILYSADYHASFWTRQEFHNFLAAVAAANGTRRIGLLRCDDDNPSGLLHGATYGDLHNVTDPAERRRIILAVARGEAPASRPAPRIFGGAMPPREPPVHRPRGGTGRAALCAVLRQRPRGADPGDGARAGTGGGARDGRRGQDLAGARLCGAVCGRVRRRLVDHRHRSTGDPDRPAGAGPRAGLHGCRRTSAWKPPRRTLCH